MNRVTVGFGSRAGAGVGAGFGFGFGFGVLAGRLGVLALGLGLGLCVCSGAGCRSTGGGGGVPPSRLGDVFGGLGAGGWGWRRGGAEGLAADLESRDPNIRYASYVGLGKARNLGSEERRGELARVMAERLREGREPLASRVAICEALGNVGGAEAREALLMAVNDPNPMVREAACRALGSVARPEDATILSRIGVVDRVVECRIAAIEALGRMRTEDPRVLGMLIDGMEDDDPAIRLASVQALRAATETDLGLNSGNWRRWLDQYGASADNSGVAARDVPAGSNSGAGSISGSGSDRS